MSHCCSSSEPEKGHPAKRRCPLNGIEYSEVSVRTMLHHIMQPWTRTLSATRYYYCEDPDCEVAYFGDDNSVVLRSQLRSAHGREQDLLCHCFGISRADFERDSSTREFVIAQTRNGTCSCETCNPSGRCCLKDFPKSPT